MGFQCKGDAGAAASGARAERRSGTERRSGMDRRTLTARTFLQGGITPRRRSGRRHDEAQSLVDWHEPHLLFLTVMILLLSVADAFMTVTLLMSGNVREANPILEYVLAYHPDLFAAIKMTLTGGGLVVLVALARARLFSMIRVSAILHWCLVGYVALIAYEWWLFRFAL